MKAVESHVEALDRSSTTAYESQRPSGMPPDEGDRGLGDPGGMQREKIIILTRLNLKVLTHNKCLGSLHFTFQISRIV